MSVADGLGHQQCHAQHEFAFGEVLRRSLMRRMRRGMGRAGGRVEPVDITQQKYPLPRHHHVIEKDRAIHLLKPRSQRLVEMRAALVKAVAAQEFEPGGITSVQYLKAMAQGRAVYEAHFGYSFKLVLWQLRLKVLHYLLHSPIGKFLYKIKVWLNLENL